MLEKLPHKNLFYFGFLVVFIFIGLSYWQLTRHQQDKLIIDSIDSKEFINEISVSDLYDLDYKFEEFTKIQLTENIENIELVRTWYLRSRVHNGENGYHLVSLYRTTLEEYFLINKKDQKILYFLNLLIGRNIFFHHYKYQYLKNKSLRIHQSQYRKQLHQ